MSHATVRGLDRGTSESGLAYGVGVRLIRLRPAYIRGLPLQGHVIVFLLAAQIAAADSVYASEALRGFVNEASLRNRTPPAGLRSYRASAESEIGIVTRRAEGMEGVFSLEQIKSDVRWRRPGEFEQRVAGYRNQSLGVQFSSLSFLRQPWAVPILYGDRLSILFGRDTSRAARRSAERRPTLAIHPLASDRDTYYRFAGGDTVVTMRFGDRELPIVRVQVEPRAGVGARTLRFRGELDIDATRHHLVRMRGYFVAPPPTRSLVSLAFAASGFEAVAFVELENGEFEGEYWLPTYQRFEAQAAWTAATDSRNVFRIVSRYQRHQINDTLVVALDSDSLISMPYRLALAPPDSLAAFASWQRDIGVLSEDIHADDFDDIAPDIWRPTGGARTNFRVQRVMDAVRVNRVEGLFTGWGVQTRFRDAFPGLTLRGNAGWAWSEQTVRGRVSAELARGSWTGVARAGRSLDITNDFRSTFDSGSTLGAVFGQDNYDYVDRYVAALGVHRRIGRSQSIWRLETGPARDEGAVRNLSRGVFRGDSGFRENRGVREGTYWRTWSALEWRPDVNAEFMRTGVGGLLTMEHAAGDLRYTRVDARLVGRKNRGRLSVVGRADAGAVWGGGVPPQQLYELGQNQNLQGYGYKEFVGDRAVVGRTLAMWRFPVFEGPMRLGRWILPGLSPAFAVGAQSAWTTLSNDQARAANLLLGTRVVGAGGFGALVVPIARPTDGVRTSVTIGLRFVGGAIGVGVARPVDRDGRWKLRVDFGQII